jgi:protocatechuate 3,4-dioxygenase beta subunit
MKLAAFLLACFSLAAQDFQISGVVVDHLTNRPLNHVLVEITQVGRGGANASVLTEADGRFTFLHVPKGKYNLQAQKRGQFPQGFHASEGGFATAIVVNGTLKTDNLVFPLRSDASISGVVTGDDGEPVRNAQVHLFHEGVVDGEVQTTQTNTVVTKSSGEFRFGHLEGGRYYIAAYGLPWYSEPEKEVVYPVTFYGDTTEAASARAITLPEGGTAEARLSLRGVPGIRVKLPNARQNVQLSVAGPGGTQIPVPAAVRGMGGAQGQIALQTDGGRLPEQAPGEWSFELLNLAAGRYQVAVTGEHGEQSQATQTVDLTNGSTLILDSHAVPAEVSGRIVFEGGVKPEGEVELFLSGNRGGVMASMEADGTFKFEKMAAGRFDLNLNSAGVEIVSVEAKGARLVHDHLEIGTGAAVDLTVHVQPVEAMSKVEGFAWRDGTGVAGAMVLLLPEDLSRVRLMRRDQSDADGSFSLSGVQPGRYTVVAIEDGRDLAYKDGKVIRGYLKDGVKVVVPMKEGAGLRVLVQGRQE